MAQTASDQAPPAAAAGAVRPLHAVAARTAAAVGPVPLGALCDSRRTGDPVDVPQCVMGVSADAVRVAAVGAARSCVAGAAGRRSPASAAAVWHLKTSPIPQTAPTQLSTQQWLISVLYT